MADTPLNDDYLALEPLLNDAVSAILPAGWYTHYLADLREPRERQGLAPAVFIGYGGDGVLDEGGEGSLNRLYQEYWTVIAVRTAVKEDAARELRSQAGAIYALLLNSAGGIAGWTPDRKVWAPLTYQPGQRPKYYIGYAEYPLLWRTRVSTRTTHNRNR